MAERGAYPAFAPLALAALLPAAAAGQDKPDAGLDAAALERLVRQDCGSCHGMTLKGGLGPDIRPQAVAQYSPEALKSVILDGLPGTAMPPWRPLLTEAQAEWIARYLLNGGAS